jgi:hypothetical protein
MASRIQNLKNKQLSQPNNPYIIEDNDRIDNMKQKTEINLPEKQAHRYTYQNKGVKPSPLRPQNMSKFKLVSKDKLS